MKISLPVTVTPSRVELGLRCYRRHVLNDVMGKGLYSSPSLEFGSVIHAGAGAFWDHGSFLAIENALQREWYTRFTMNPRVHGGELTLDLALGMMRNYVDQAKLAGPFQAEGQWQLVATEERLEFPLPLADGKAKLSFQTDRIVWNKATRHLVVVDTKTGARLDKKWERQWETSLQMKLYKVAVAKAFDFEASTVDIVVEGLLKDIPSSVRYVPCPDWSQGLLDEALAQAVHIAERDHVAISSHGLPKDVGAIAQYAVNGTEINYQCCFEYGVECAYRRLCTADPMERMGILQADYFDLPQEEY